MALHLHGTRASSDDVDLTRAKAKKMLKHGEVRGKRLTKKQKGLFGVIASGKKPRK